MTAADLTGKHVVVTGGTGGLGPAVVAALRDAGATCHLPVRGDAGAAGAGAPVGERINVIGGVDLTSEAAVARFYAGLSSLWASVHVAGGYAAAPLLETTLADFRFQQDMNLTTCFLCCREAARRIRGAGGGGRLVNLGSRAALELKGGSVAYSVAKAGVVALTRCLADELAGDGILVNAVIPSIIDTPANRRAMPTANSAAWPKPEQLAAVIAWLCSPENSLASGASVPVYGAA